MPEENPGNAARRSRRRAAPIGPDEIEAARGQMARALSLEGLVTEDGRAVCPECGEAARGKTKVFADGAFHCYKGGHHVHNAIDLLVGRGWKFIDAVRVLNGNDAAIPEELRGRTKRTVAIAPTFNAHPDIEVYEAVLAAGDVDAACEFYGRWYISEEVVRESRAVVITNPAALARDLVANFPPERLVACGLASEEGKLYITNHYPVIEPHLLPKEGSPCTAMQFRGSEATERRVAEHKAYKEAKKAAQEAGRTYRGPKVDYVPKFLSLRGARLEARCGFGLPRLGELAEAADAARARGETPRPKKVYIVEGFKDLLAARTLGVEAYGLAGAGLLPVRAVCQIISRVGVAAVSLDGDEEGENGRARLMEHFSAHGVTAEVKLPPPGMDMCDVLVAKREGRELPTRDTEQTAAGG